MIGWRSLVLVATVAAFGALGTLAVGAATGMHADELVHLGLLLLPAIGATVVAMAIAQPLLARSSLRQGLGAVAAVAVAVSLANLAILARQMFVSGHDATLVAILLLYSVGTGVGAAFGLARAQTRAVDRLMATTRSLGSGDLGARTGSLEAAPELDALARTIDEMAEHLATAIARERDIEARRRDLMTAVSHDLRTPIANLRAMVEAIDEGVVEDLPSLRRYAGEMRRSVNALVGLVDDLFELAQLDAGAIEAETERARLAEIVHSAIAAVEVQAVEKGLSLETELDGAADAECSPRLGRVLQNLLQNAVRHTPRDGTVRILARRAAGELELAVEDTGEGIEAGDLPNVFEPFWRGDPARSGGGSGLGLTLAKRIVEALGGRIEAASEPAGGSRFAVLLPG